MSVPSTGPCCSVNHTVVSTLAPPVNVTVLVVSHTDTLLRAVTVILIINTALSLFLNILLVFIIQYSPSLRTPPNSHLLSICINNLLLCLDMLLCTVLVNFSTLDMTSDKRDVLSGVQLFLTYGSLMQYWGTFTSIGYYRYRTIKTPSLSLRCRRKLVSKCVICNWLASSVLGLMLSLSYAQNSRYISSTLDPFMKDYIASEEGKLSQQTLVAVTLIALLTFCFGLGFIITAYCSICRTLNVVSVVGRNRISPRQQSPHIHSDSSDLTLAVGQTYRPQYTLSTPSYLGATLTNDKDIFTVIFTKHDNSVAISDFKHSENKEVQEHATPEFREMYSTRRQLTSTSSNASTCSVKAPEFTDISIGADLLRFQKQHSQIMNRRQSYRRETISLNNAIRNSLAMLIVYLTCSLPLIVVTIPGSMSSLTALQRLRLLLGCRILFYLNAPAYPLWYMGFSVTVKKCFIRLWEAVVVKCRNR